MPPTAEYLELLRTLGDVTRLRLLLLCANDPVSVSALAQALRESQPSISRHLKLLAGAGLLRRQRRGHFVEYRTQVHPSRRALLDAVLREFPQDDSDLLAAREALAAGSERSVNRRPPAGRFEHALRQRLLEQLSPGTLPLAIAVGEGTLPMLDMLTTVAQRVILAADSIAERTRMRRYAADAAAQVETVLGAQLAGSLRTERADLLIAYCGLQSSESIDTVAALAGRVLQPTGQAFIIVDYDALEAQRQGAPALALRRALIGAGLECEALSPLESQPRHVLIARGRPRVVQSQKSA